MTCVTQQYLARQGTTTPQMQRVAEREELPVELVRDEVARGRLIIPANVNHLAGRLDLRRDGKCVFGTAMMPSRSGRRKGGERHVRLPVVH